MTRLPVLVLLMFGLAHIALATNPIPWDDADEWWAGEGNYNGDVSYESAENSGSGESSSSSSSSEESDEADCDNQLPPNTKPNIIFILADDWGWNDVGYNNPEVVTPNIDKLAAEGVRLEQNYVYAACTPSRASLMTGMEAFHIGRQSNVFWAASLGGLTLDRKILPEYLKDLGYNNHIVGKWHLGHCNPAYLATNRGFDTQYGIQLSGQWNEAHLSYFDPHPFDFFDQDNITRTFDVMSGFQMDLYRERALQIIQDQADLGANADPMFLYMAFTSTHFPVEAPYKFLKLYPDVDDSEKRQSFLAMTSHMDDVIGQTVAKLKETGLYDNSIIVYMSDNGAYSTKWPWLPWYGGGSNLPLRGQKTEAHEGGLRVPGLIHSPLISCKQRGSISNKIVHVSDWLPTLITAAGGDVATFPELADLDGVDQYDALFRRNLARPRRSFTYNIRTFRGQDPTNGQIVTFYQGAVRYGRWKLLNFNGNFPLFPLGEVYELYDLVNDPNETTNVAADYPDVYDRMLAKFFEAAVTEMPPNGQGEVPEADQLIILDNLGNLRTDFCDLNENLVA